MLPVVRLHTSQHLCITGTALATLQQLSPHTRQRVGLRRNVTPKNGPHTTLLLQLLLLPLLMLLGVLTQCSDRA